MPLVKAFRVVLREMTQRNEFVRLIGCGCEVHRNEKDEFTFKWCLHHQHSKTVEMQVSIGYTCPICGHHANKGESRTCPRCTYRGDWIQPGQKHLYGCDGGPECICKRLALQMFKEGK